MVIESLSTFKFLYFELNSFASKKYKMLNKQS